MMRKINTGKARRATRTTSREINRTIVLNLVREHQPVSRAELARLMKVQRGVVTALVSGLLEEGVIYESTPARPARGRPPIMLRVRTRDRLVVAVDVRLLQTAVALYDLGGTRIALRSLPTVLEPEALAASIAREVAALLRAHDAEGDCEGIGLVVPGMVDRRSGRILNSPALGWRGVDLREMLAERVGMRVFIENAPIACALARMWLTPARSEGADSFAYVTVSDGVGAGVVVNGEVLRGHNDTAGEFGHLPLNVEGPVCLCGLRGCLEAYTSNLATLGRYLGLDPALSENRTALRENGLTIPDLIARARQGDARARSALDETAHALGMGLAGIITSLNPERIFVGGEITDAWELIGPTVLRSARERTLTEVAASTPIIPVAEDGEARLRGATALLVARQFAAPKLA